jgi:nitroreductase
VTVFEAIEKRKSVRNYLNKPVEEEKLLKVLEAARLAPSAGNRQEWRFIVVTGKSIREELSSRSTRHSFIGEAPIILVCCAEGTDHVMPCGLHSFPIDLAIAIDHITLAAVEEGLGTCWIGGFDEAIVKDVLGIPDAIRVVELLPLGYPADGDAVGKSRAPMDKIVRYDKW